MRLVVNAITRAQRLVVALIALGLAACSSQASTATPAASAAGSAELPGLQQASVSSRPLRSGGTTPVSASAQVAPAGGAGQEPVTLKVMTQHVVTDVALYIAQERGYFKEQDLNIQFQDISNGSDAVPFVSTGKLDVAVGSPGAGLFNAMARGINVKLVADKGAVSPDGKNGFTGLQ